MDLFAPLLVESSQTRDWTHVPCIGRPILIHHATREVRKKAFLVLQYRTLKSTVVQHDFGHRVDRQKSYWLDEAVEVGADRQQQRRRAGCNFIHAWCWKHRFWFLAGFNSIYLLEQKIQWFWVVTLFFFSPCHWWHSTTGLHSEQLLHSLYYFTFGSCALKINSISSNRTNFYWWLDMRIHVCIFHNLKVCVRRIYCIWMS